MQRLEDQPAFSFPVREVDQPAVAVGTRRELDCVIGAMDHLAIQQGRTGIVDFQWVGT